MLDNKNVVKVITDKKLEESNFPTALNFTRNNLSTDYQKFIIILEFILIKSIY